MAIISIVAVMCASAFMMILGAETRETNTRLASEQAEDRIATGDAPTTTASTAISLGGFTIPSSVETYAETAGGGDTISTENGRIDVSGDRSYTVLKSLPESPPELFHILYGASIPHDPDNGLYSGIVAMEYPVPHAGRYKLEVWGSSGYSHDSSVTKGKGGAGGYAVGVISLDKGETLYLRPGDVNGLTEYSGGASADVRIGVDDLYHRVIVAGGGGSSTFRPSNDPEFLAPGGYAGGGDGINSQKETGGKAATIDEGGVGSSSSSPKGQAGSFGYGGQGTNMYGGGDGWYGGGAGGQAKAFLGILTKNLSGGGGSNWVFTEANYNAWTNATDKPNYAFDLNSEYLMKTETISGVTFNGVPVNNFTITPDTISGNSAMPDPYASSFNPLSNSNTTMVGNEQPAGAVCVTYLGQ
jgi:hypothetical protein